MMQKNLPGIMMIHQKVDESSEKFCFNLEISVLETSHILAAHWVILMCLFFIN